MDIDNYAKVDFHIHSKASVTKNGDIEKVKEGTFENIDLLMKKMDTFEINMFSFTDHNVFDYDLYNKTKNYIKSEDFKTKYKNIKKILPGIEFDLKFDNSKTRVHATCIFDDYDEKLLEELNEHVSNKINGRKMNELIFTEKELNDILSDIGLNFILIVHQTTDINNENVKGKNDFSNVNEDKKAQLLYYDYFTMYEAKQHRFRISFEDYKKRKGISGNFITGSDCHNWSKYPNDNKDFEFSYIKSNYTFEGLKIAVTGNGERRIFNKKPLYDEKIIKTIRVQIGNDIKEIPLSCGINAIIGGNTSGKSLLFAKMFNKIDKNKKPDVFLKKWNIDFKEQEIDKEKLEYVSQGAIREKFEDNGSSLIIEFKELFKKIDYAIPVEKINKAKDILFSHAERNSRINDFNKKISCIINIPNYEDATYYPQITPLPIKPKNPTKPVYANFEKVITILKELQITIDKQHISEMESIVKKIQELSKYYLDKNDKELFIIQSYYSFLSGTDDYKKFVEESGITNTDKELLLYENTVATYINNVSDLIEIKLNSLPKLTDTITNFKIDTLYEGEKELKYVTSPKVDIYDNKVVRNILFNPLKLKCDDFDGDKIYSITIENLVDSINNNTKEEINNLNIYQKYSLLLNEEINKNYFVDLYKILLKDEEIQDTKSPGNNAIYYLKAKASSLNNKLVVYDQPEDDVSPGKLSRDVVDSLSKIALSNQVIIITHRPQLVVNLDVDNVICLDTSDNEYKIYNGPLYEKENCDMLEIIADKLEGGADALKERWKRYE